MTDKFGIKLNIGDDVIFATGGQSDTTLKHGAIIELNENTALIFNKETKRKMQQKRLSSEIVSMVPYFEARPEILL